MLMCEMHFFFWGGDMWSFHFLARLCLGGKRIRDHLPVRATLNVHSANHGARPWPKLAPECTGGPPALPSAQPRARGKARGRKIKVADVEKVHWVDIHARFP